MEISPIELSIWELERRSRIVAWTKDFVLNTVTYVLDDVKSGEKITFEIVITKL